MTKAKKTESVAEILARRKANANGKTKTKTATPKKEGKKKPALNKSGKNVTKKNIKQTQNNSNKDNDKKELNSDLLGLRHPQGYLAFIDFLATPDYLREYDTQAEFAQSIGVDPTTLVAWKKRDGFWADLREQRRNFIREELLTKSISALMKKILKEGNASEVKLLHQLADEFEEKSVVENRSPVQALSVERKEQILQNIKNWKKK
jgi:hypothetical protein